LTPYPKRDQRLSLFDDQEGHDLRELADAAYSHSVEEALTRELNEGTPP
jgi:hypothetical protein